MGYESLFVVQCNKLIIRFNLFFIFNNTLNKLGDLNLCALTQSESRTNLTNKAPNLVAKAAYVYLR